MKKIILLLPVLFLAAGCNIFGGGGVLGVVKTLDGGGSWQASDLIDNTKSGSISNLPVSEMAFDPTNHETIFISTTTGGLWVSTNSARTWKQLLSRITAYDFFVDPSNTRNIFVVGIYGGHGKIIRTRDAGATWEEIYNEASNNNSVNTITANPENSRELYAGLNSGVVIKSTDSGDNWFVVQDFKDQVLKLRYDEFNNSLYALMSSKGLKKSTDGGLHWNSLTDQLNGGDSGFSLLSNPVNRFIKLGLDDQAGGVIYLTTDGGLYKTANDGKNWSYLNIPIKASAQLPRAIASTHGGVLAYTSIGSTIFKTLDGGKSWQTQPLPTGNSVNKIIIDPVLPQITYAGLTNSQ